MDKQNDNSARRVEYSDQSNQLFCKICNKPLLDNGEGMVAEIRRGYSFYPDNRSDNGGVYCEHLKFSIFLCQDCYLNDPDFCRFMNKINCRTR